MSHRIVQTVLVKRQGEGGYTRREAEREVRALGHDPSNIDDSSGNYWRFRQVQPRDVRFDSFHTFEVKPGVLFVYAELKPLRAGARTNPTPAAWNDLGPNQPYPCKTTMLGKHIPGVKGRQGKVVSCATPSARAYDRTGEGNYRLGNDPRQRAHRKGQVLLERAGNKWPVSRSYAGRKLRESALGPGAFTRGENRNEIEGRIRDLENEPHHVPVPVGLEFRHRTGSNRCAPDHPMWSSPEWNDILEGAMERAASRADRMNIPVESGDVEFRPNPATSYEELLVQELKRDARARKYLDAEKKCIEGFRARNARRRNKGYTSPQFLAAEERRRAEQEGIDLSSNEYRDTLSAKTRKKLSGKRPGGAGGFGAVRHGQELTGKKLRKPAAKRSTSKSRKKR